MITLLIGDNASGNTAYLKSFIQKKVSEGCDLIDNIFPSGTLTVTDIDAKRFAEINDITETLFGVEFSMSCQDMSEFSETFYELLKLICRRGTYLCLDEPEFDLSSFERSALVKILGRVEDTFDEIVIGTHYSGFTLLNPRYKSIKVNNDKFIAISVDGDINEKIDSL